MIEEKENDIILRIEDFHKWCKIHNPKYLSLLERFDPDVQLPMSYRMKEDMEICQIMLQWAIKNGKNIDDDYHEMQMKLLLIEMYSANAEQVSKILSMPMGDELIQLYEEEVASKAPTCNEAVLYSVIKQQYLIY